MCFCMYTVRVQLTSADMQPLLQQMLDKAIKILDTLCPYLNPYPNINEEPARSN